MKVLFKISLRNILRRKLQTYLLGFMIAFTTFLIFLMAGMQTGSYKLMEDSYTKIFQGDFQIKNKDFKNAEDDFNKLVDPKETLELKNKLKNYSKTKINYSKRTASYALAEANNKNYSFAFVGVEPENEKNVSLVSKNIKQGSYFTSNQASNSIIVGQGIAEFLKLKIGSEVVIMTADIYSSFVVDLFKVTGIFKIGDSQIDNTAFIDINYFYNNVTYSNKFSYLVVKLNNSSKRNDLISYLNKDLGNNLKIVPWNEILPEIQQSIEFDKISSIFFYVILVTIIGLIILNSLTLSTTKRFQEFGILSAIGLNNKNFKYILLIENTILATIFVTIGSIVAFIVLFYLSFKGVKIPASEVMQEGFDYALLSNTIYPEIYNSFLLLGPCLVFMFCLLATIPSIIRINKLKPIEAIYSN